MRAIIIVLLAAGLAACGQTGSLYLPDDSVTTPVEIRGPAAGTPAAAPTTAEDAEKAKKSEAPAPPPES